MKRTPRVNRPCEVCGVSVTVTVVAAQKGFGRFCSRSCKNRGLVSPERDLSRFWSYVEKAGPDDCWLWTGFRNKKGYGRATMNGRLIMAHRVSYELAFGPVPTGLFIDHVKARGCTNRNCVNPAHLEPVTTKENVLRGTGITARNAKKTHCPHGHPYAGNNLILRFDPNGSQHRYCRACLEWKRKKAA